MRLMVSPGKSMNASGAHHYSSGGCAFFLSFFFFFFWFLYSERVPIFSLGTFFSAEGSNSFFFHQEINEPFRQSGGSPLFIWRACVCIFFATIQISKQYELETQARAYYKNYRVS